MLLQVRGQVDRALPCIIEVAAHLALGLLVEVEARLGVVDDLAAGEHPLVDVHVARAAHLGPQVEHAVHRVVVEVAHRANRQVFERHKLAVAGLGASHTGSSQGLRFISGSCLLMCFQMPPYVFLWKCSPMRAECPPILHRS